MQFVLHSSSILAPALRHALVSVLGLPAPCVEASSEGPHRVTLDGRTFRGLQPVVQALRRIASTPEQIAFLGEVGDDGEQAALVNQWVSAAAVLDVDAARAGADATASVAKALYSDVERILVASAGAAPQFLTGSDRATMADLLLYAAAFNHPAHAEVLPATMRWAAFVQTDAYVVPIRAAAVATPDAATAKTSKAGAAPKGDAASAKAEVTYVKPSEDEILRRRAEKEKAKAEKAAAAAAAAAAGGSGGSDKPSSSPSTDAPESNKTKKSELDSTSLCVRVGRFTNLRRHPNADRLYVEDMVLGEETRTIVSGLVEQYTAEELEGTQCLVVCNMKPKPLMGVTSQGMVLCAKKGEAVQLIRPPAGAAPGDRVLFGAAYDATLAAAAAPAILAGSKMSELLSHLHTDANGVLCWKDAAALHSSGASVSIADMPDCPVS
ncbi:putative tRNA binding domain containing protein [Novymonas esmeraldas]|uniref:tRNA binding domain containing protein n=1 Tax=Novymonas esmeraldas TaxID=1808958 RepID=A0AAW0ETQ9_9TRYP